VKECLGYSRELRPRIFKVPRPSNRRVRSECLRPSRILKQAETAVWPRDETRSPKVWMDHHGRLEENVKTGSHPVKYSLNGVGLGFKSGAKALALIRVEVVMLTVLIRSRRLVRLEPSRV